MAIKDTIVRLLWKQDRQSLSETMRGSNQIEKSLGKVGDSAKDAASELNRLIKEQDGIKKLAKETHNAADGFRDIADQAEKAGSAAKNVSSGGGGEIGIGGAAGRLESATSAAAGLGGTESLRPLADAAGLVDQVSASFETGNITLGATTAAIGVLTLALGALSKSAQEAKAVAASELSAVEEYYNFIQTATTPQLQERLQAEEAAAAAAQRNLDALMMVKDGLLQGANDVGVGIAGLNVKIGPFGDDLAQLIANLGTGEGEIQATDEAITKANATIAEHNRMIDLLSNSFDAASVAANDAAAAEEELKTAREESARAAAQAAIQDATAAGELARVKAESKSLYAEDIANRIQANSLRKTQLEAELASLQATGDVSELVTERIKSLQKELGNLGETTKVLQSAAKTAPSREAEQARKKAQQGAKSASDQAAKSAEDRAKRLHDIQTNTQQKLEDLQTKFARDEESARIDMYDKLEDIRRKAEIEEGKAAEQRDFLQLADARDAAKDEARAVERENERSHRDRMRELQYANNDVMLEQRRALQDLQESTRRKVAIEKQGATASLNIMTNWAKAFERIFSGVPLPGGATTGRNSSGLQDLAAVL